MASKHAPHPAYGHPLPADAGRGLARVPSPRNAGRRCCEAADEGLHGEMLSFYDDMIALVAFLLATEFPSNSKTSWMRPESFHLVVGMSRSDTVKTLEEVGWKMKKGDDDQHLIIDYADDKAVTLQFHRDRLRSIRFELFTFLPDARTAFNEEKAFLRESLGRPKRLKSKSVLLYDATLPNVMVVLSADPKSQNGSQGLGILVV